MVERGRGAVLNLASTAAFQPLPRNATYAASKAFVLSFTDALHAELQEHRRHRHEPLPGPREDRVRGGGGHGRRRRERALASSGRDADFVAEEGVKGLEGGKRVVVPGKFNAAGALGGQHVPRSAAAALRRALLADAVRRARGVPGASCAAATGCGGDGDENERDTAPTPPPATRRDSPRRREARRPGPQRGRARGARRWPTGLEAPWEIAFLPDGRALVTERPGRVRLLERDLTLRDEPMAEVEVAAIGEGGLLGAAVDPRSRATASSTSTGRPTRATRWCATGSRATGWTDETVIVEGIAAAAIHDGGRIHFGPDGRLYFSTGDAAQDDLAQDPDSLNGKILRLAPGSTAATAGAPRSSRSATATRRASTGSPTAGSSRTSTGRTATTR